MLVEWIAMSVSRRMLELVREATQARRQFIRTLAAWIGTLRKHGLDFDRY